MVINKIKNTLIYKVFESHYCKIVFVISLIISYLLIPKDVFKTQFIYLALIYMVLFSIILTCIVRIIKERIKSAIIYEKSILGILASGIGLAALQACTLSISCSASVGLSILYLIFPQFFVSFLMDYSQYVLIASIIIQAIAIYLMGCFRKVLDLSKNKIKVVQLTKKS
jgi:Na+/melibiose symporter-like transporter